MGIEKTYLGANLSSILVCQKLIGNTNFGLIFDLSSLVVWPGLAIWIMSSRNQILYRICVALLDLLVVVAVALILSADFTSLNSCDCSRVDSSLLYVCSAGFLGRSLPHYSLIVQKL